MDSPVKTSVEGGCFQISLPGGADHLKGVSIMANIL